MKYLIKHWQAVLMLSIILFLLFLLMAFALAAINFICGFS